MDLSITKKETTGLVLKALIIIVVILLFSILKSAFTTAYDVNVYQDMTSKVYYNDKLTEIYSFKGVASGTYTSIEYMDEDKETFIKHDYLFDYVVDPDAKAITLTFFKTEDNIRTLSFVKNGLIDLDNNSYYLELVE